MNRQQRRARERELEARRRLEKRIEKTRADEKYKEIEVELYYTAFGLALEEVYGFKEKRILKAWRRADEIMGKLCSGEMTFDEMKQQLKERANIECSFR